MNTRLRPNQLGYIGLGVSDIEAWEVFGTEVLGLESNGRDDDGSLQLRMDDYHYRFIVYEDKDLDDLQLVGWEMQGAQELADLAGKLGDRGFAVTPGSDELKAKRRVVDLIQFSDPNGLASEAYYGPLITREKPFKSGRSVSNFVAGDQGLGHIVISVQDRQETLNFYQDLLGLRISDWVHPQGDSSRTLTFMHCNSRHHSLAFWDVETPKRLHHFLVEVERLDDVGATHDLCQGKNIPIVISLGRHTNDEMLSFYVETPSGFAVEYGWGGINLETDDWDVRQHLSGSVWGHKR